LEGRTRNATAEKVTAERTHGNGAAPAGVATRTIAIAATFTAEPIESTIDFWSRTLKAGWQVAFAPYNQVFQEIYSTDGLLARNRGVNVVLLRVEDWGTDADRNAEDFVRGVTAFAARAASPTIVVVCPISESSRAHAARRDLLERAENFIRSRLTGVQSLHVAGPRDIAQLYPVEHYDDPVGEHESATPYTPSMYVALGTLLSRWSHALLRAPWKVVVLDCDNTLWKGVVGEDGVRGIEIDEGRRALQQKMVHLHDSGVLICLCSKNVEEDVEAVFATRGDMLLKSDHIVRRRVNWRAKSENIRALGRELNLGLDSFVFIDDNPIECAEVLANCPGVTVAQLPQESGAISAFVASYWPFDQIGATREDRQRALMYRQESRREELRSKVNSLQAFLEQLELKIDIAPMTATQRPRVAQLTQRTNQFNTTTKRRSEAELEDQLKAPGCDCRVVELRDRFGDYGLIGTAIYCFRDDALVVDSLLLSCRALGRGVEHRLLAELGRLAGARALPAVHVPFVASKKNAPAFAFLDSVGAQFRHDDGNGQVTYRFPTEMVAALEFRPPDDALEVADDADNRPTKAGDADKAAVEPATWERIANELSSVPAILAAMASGPRRALADAANYRAPSNDVEANLAAIWQVVLGVAKVGVADDYFELGGDSVRAVQILARARQSGMALTLQQFFENPTIEKLALHVKHTTPKPLMASEATAIPPADARSHLAPTGEFDDSFPLAGTQRVMLQNYSHVTGAYHFQQAIRFVDLEPPVSLGALEESLRRLMARQHMMRAAVFDHQGVMMQGIRRASAINVQREDLSKGTEGSDAWLARVLRDDRATPFDPTSGAAALRIALARVSDREFIYVTSGHHAFGDAWGYLSFLSDVFRLYRLLKRGDEASSQRLVESTYGASNVYREFVTLEGAARESDEMRSFWKRHLSPVETLPVPVAHRRPLITAPITSALGPALTEGVRREARRRRVHTKALILSSYVDSVAAQFGTGAYATVGAVTNGRSESLSDSLRPFGLFWRFVPICVAIVPDKDAQVAAVHSALLETEAHSSYPLPDIQKDLGRAPFFATFNYIHFHNATWEDGSLGLRMSSTEVRDAFHFPVNLKAWLSLDERNLSLTLTVDEAYISREQAEALLQGTMDRLQSVTRSEGVRATAQ
jgi:FkbH-like protein